ncbi:MULTISPECIES: Asp23/Gls24 family envelope stress response protein [unclassified Streptosporangium]|uniref:Asp23/Gls24 family envelope stress response protein n=1 Tax=unclassified Streptosporangium TaxID=2632669 RepID=UPI002E2AEC0C|nr:MULTISPECIES: Asp23/Gls24 family envelope stress response protein [unclassified Streptosporangium]
MNTPVEHRPPSSGTAADPDPPPARRGDSGLPESGRSGLPAVPAQPSPRGVPAERRGRTEISDRVVSRIAAHAAGEVARVGEVGERGPLSFRGGTRATLDGELATLQLDVTVEYPAPIREVAEEVRRHVAERVMALTGKDVGYIDITVTGVTPARDTSRTRDAVPAAGEDSAESSAEDPARHTGRAGAEGPERAGDPADAPTEDIVPLREER